MELTSLREQKHTSENEVSCNHIHISTIVINNINDKNDHEPVRLCLHIGRIGSVEEFALQIKNREQNSVVQQAQHVKSVNIVLVYNQNAMMKTCPD